MEIAVVSFSDHALADTLNCRLTKLGYAPCRIGYDTWLTMPVGDLHRPAVIVFDSDSFPRARVIAALGHSNRCPSLGVFFHANFLSDRDLLHSLSDFVSWPCSSEELKLRLDRVCPQAMPYNAVSVSLSATDFARLNLVGCSPKFVAALGMIERIAACDAPVVIEGETGTGKEAAARAVHYASARRSYPFVPINCGAIPDNLIESELFGHERGAFTDAKEARQGVIAQAEGGTLFLDEVDSLSTKAQVTLLRFLQDRQYRSLGSNRMRNADVRIVAATNADLQQQVEQGRFRADLMFRLQILSLRLPSLRERVGDIALLAKYFVERLGARYSRSETRIAPVLLEWMEVQRWPGNVRELESFIHRKLLMSEPGAMIAPDAASDLPLNAPQVAGAVASEDRNDSLFRVGKQQLIATFERSMLSKALSEHGGNVTRAAKHVGKERRAFGKLLKKHNIVVDSYRRLAID